MTASHHIDRSICGALLSTRPPPFPSPRPVSTRPSIASRCCRNQSGRIPGCRQAFSWAPVMDKADPASGTLLPFLCPPSRIAPRRIVSSLHTTTTRPRRCPITRAPNTATVRTNHSSATAPMPAVPTPTSSSAPITNASSFWGQRRPQLSKDDLLSFVDPPGEGDSVDEHLNFIRDPYMRRYAPAGGPELVISHSREDAEFPTWNDVRNADVEVQKRVKDLGRAVWKRLGNPSKMSAVEVYEQYRMLPEARMAYIPASLRHQLLKSLGMVEKKNSQSMLRYFSVLADVKDSGFSLWMAEWNAAISFASRYVGMSTASETESAVNLWREMEQDAGIHGNEVTFNILFDVASKAGNFTLAEMVYQEMERRGFQFNRYHHVSLIHFFGLKMDSDGVRAAYQEMVEAGEMIDVVVLNCVMVSFLRCGEEDAAERVYSRMRHSYIDRLKEASSKRAAKKAAQEDARRNSGSQSATVVVDDDSPSVASAKESSMERDAAALAASTSPDTTNFASQKVMTSVLMMLAKVSKGDAKLRASFQHLVPTRPDIATYRILINHFAVKLGDLSTVARYLNDMKTLRIPLHGAIFLALFKGFALHGGKDGSGSDWSEQRLRGIWAALLKALDEDAAGLYIGTWMFVWSLRAFDRCSTSEMVFKAYNSLSSRWDPTEAEADFAIGFLHNLLKNNRPSGGGSRGDGGGRTSVLGQLGSQAFGS